MTKSITEVTVPQLLIPVKETEDSKLEKSIHGVNSTLDSFKHTIVTRIEKVEKEISKLAIPTLDTTNSELKTLSKDVNRLNGLFKEIDKSRKDTCIHTDKVVDDVFKDNFDTLIKNLNDSIKTYFNANLELQDKFQNIENNILTNYDSLKEFIKIQPHDPLDYMFLKDHFNKLSYEVNDFKKMLNKLIQDKDTNKYRNPFICEVIFKKELPVAEFSNFNKAMVYKDGLFKNKIKFYKNDGKNWLKV